MFSLNLTPFSVKIDEECVNLLLSCSRLAIFQAFQSIFGRESGVAGLFLSLSRPRGGLDTGTTTIKNRGFDEVLPTGNFSFFFFGHYL